MQFFQFNFYPMKKALPLLLASVALLAQAALGQNATTTPVGAITITGQGKVNGSPAYTFVSFPFVKSDSYSGIIGSISSAVLTVSSPAWTVDQFNSNNQKFYIEITSGSASGKMSDVVDTSTDSVTAADNLASIGALAGDKFAIREHMYVKDVFGTTNQAGLLADGTGEPNLADNILIMTPETQLITSIFYSTYPGYVGWMNSGSWEDASSVVIYPENGFYLLRRGTTNVNFVVTGTLKLGQTGIAISQGYTPCAVISPFVASDPAPISQMLTLGNSQLYTGNASTGIAPCSDDSPADNDQILVVNPATQIMTAYFYSTYPGYEGWRDTGNWDDATNVVMPSGSMFFVIRRPGNAPFNWTQSQKFVLSE